ncbi:hypothetical protein ERJ70_12410 [Sediminibacillus dalangtanensis]|uniref:YhfM-like domain-containing protein n=1 Tax=Sediminibacillus dalangtanensis TaxID=2729421 RepID=A0ABX7VWP0_9BACI|nr:hypothetical protein [Sediminibacillus dalangtanensis]QTN00026.1 hypothetical protein ERJ70_12410 [Sediminibacillus dalangtanensis]
MKKFMVLAFLICGAITLVGCQATKERMTLLDTITEVSISKSGGYVGLNENYFLTINRVETISGFEKVLKNTKGISHDVDVTNEKPDYDILIRYENGNTHGLHLQLGNAGEESVIMYIGHERNGYIVSPKDTNELRKLLGVSKTLINKRVAFV